MKRRYGLLIIILLFFLSGIGARLINQNFTFDYLYRILIKREFSTNPRVEVRPDKGYRVRIWYYPFYRTVAEKGTEKDFFAAVVSELQRRYPNIEVSIGRLSFLKGREQLEEALAAGEPPDLYFNFSGDFLIDRKWQLPVELYLDEKEKTAFYTLDRGGINRDHLWGWPFLVQEQSWLANFQTGNKELNFQQVIGDLPRETLLLNYPDLTLLRQLLSLQGLEEFILEAGVPDAETSRAIQGAFSWLHQLREKELFALSTISMEDRFLEAFFKEKQIVLGPLNPWLENYLLQSGKDKYSRISLNGLLQVFSLSVFRQKKYLGDDHTRAVMETARLIAEKFSAELAGDLGLRTAYLESSGSGSEVEEPFLLLQIDPGTKGYWEETIGPVWLDFWEQGLTPAEVMARLSR